MVNWSYFDSNLEKWSQIIYTLSIADYFELFLELNYDFEAVGRYMH